jgi:AcrR family transcriptional regulator
LKYSFPSDFNNIQPAHKKILIESEKVLGNKGISGLELKNIAKVLKVAPSTINYYYVSSEELIFDTALFSYEKYANGIVQKSTKISDSEKVLRIWIDQTFEWTKNLPGIGVILDSTLKNRCKFQLLGS